MEKEKDEPVIYKCLTSADRRDEGCEEEEEGGEGTGKEKWRGEKGRHIRRGWVRSKMGEGDGAGGGVQSHYRSRHQSTVRK